MNDEAGQTRPCFFKIVTASAERRSLAHCHYRQRIRETLQHWESVTCSTLKTGGTCNMFPKVNLSFNSTYLGILRGEKREYSSLHRGSWEVNT